jgi:hypothetical protein
VSACRIPQPVTMVYVRDAWWCFEGHHREKAAQFGQLARRDLLDVPTVELTDDRNSGVAAEPIDHWLQLAAAGLVP